MQDDLLTMITQKWNCDKLNLNGLKMSKAKFNTMGLDKPKYNGMCSKRAVDVSADKKAVVLTIKKRTSERTRHLAPHVIRHKLPCGSKKILNRMKNYLLNANIPPHHTWNALRRASTLIRANNKPRIHKTYKRRGPLVKDAYVFN